ncbi:MAG TPA: ABC transporter substrate-binding protein, partial [Desulfurococcaceae archaeon]|nr:ABC transporter substrate-binding protein [Desulfurococcaceae archaeon]
MVIQASLLLEDKAILPDNPKRIISLTPSITDTLVMLGLLNRIVGVSSFCKIYVPMVKDKPIVGSYMNVNWDKINELDPDLILLGMGVQSKLIRMFLEKGYNV